MTIQPSVVGITVSVDFGLEEYGKGTKNFLSMTGKYPDPGVPIEELDAVINAGMDYYIAAWKSLLSSRYVTGTISGKELQTKFSAAETRLAKLQKFLQDSKEETPA